GEPQLDPATAGPRCAVPRRAVSAPGENYRYNGGATALLAAIVQRVTGRKLVEYARDVLFTPLGIAEAEWITYPDGDPIAASGLRLRPRDLAKIGQLYLSGGRREGKPVAPADWLQESIRTRIDLGGGYAYGYQWWLGRSAVRDRAVRWAAARGDGGAPALPAARPGR